MGMECLPNEGGAEDQPARTYTMFSIMLPVKAQKEEDLAKKASK